MAKAELTAAKKLQDARNLRRMLAMARSESNILLNSYRDTFDRDNFILNCPNGTIDLRTGTLREHKREDYCTKICGVEYDPNAKAPGYGMFLESIFDGDPELITYIRRFAGIILSGDVSTQTFHVFHGSGSNGKSVLLELWLALLADYGLKLPAQSLVNDKHAQRHPCDIADLAGVRFAIASESDQSGKLDESKIKELSGGDTITARLMRQNFFRFDPTFKIVLCTNHKPKVNGVDHGLWRRLRLVPFGVRFWKESERDADSNCNYDIRHKADPRMPELLRSELQGVLADAVREAVAFFASGRKHEPPKSVLAATKEYRAGEDVTGQFCDERIVVDDAGRTASKTIYTAYKEWAEALGHKPAGSRTISDYLSNRYGEAVKSTGGKNCYRVTMKAE